MMRLSVRKIVLAVALLFGVLVGVGSFTFTYGEGFSYFSTDPRACVNCHIMRPQYDSWQKSSHHAVATCVDCHLPHTFFAKYIAKADNGYRHSWAFTFQDFHEPIQMIPRNRRILQNNCVTCHGELVHPLVAGSTTAENSVSCVHCHADVGHGPRALLGR
jgi:cytochrome c nitrite reductase small subunit